MARKVKEREFAVKRNEILDVAQSLVYTKGYEQMTIQDILGALNISKGAFYHYFDSKSDLLEALIERSMDEVEAVLLPIVDDPDLPALEKLQRYFDTAGRWKTERKAYMLALFRVWYNDHNAIVRQKMFASGVKRIEPMFTKIIQQGIQEGAFTTPFPDQAGELIFAIFQSLGEVFAQALLSKEADQDHLQRQEDFQKIKNSVAAYTDALERVLGAPPGSLALIDEETMNEWFHPQEELLGTRGDLVVEQTVFK